MTLFWSLAIALLAAVLALLLPPLLRRRPHGTGTGRTGHEVEAYRAGLRRLEADARAGLLAPDAHEEAKRDLERELLGALERVPEAPAEAPREPRRGASRAVAAAIAVLVPAGAVALYWQTGSLEAITWAGADAKRVASAPPAGTGAGDVEDMAQSLAARLEREPDDLDGWMLLARTYVVLERFDRALAAYARAHALAPDDPRVLVDWTEAELLANDNRFSPAAAARIERALTIAPEMPKALWLGALAALQQGERGRALGRFERVLAGLDPASEAASTLRGVIARVRGEPADALAAAPDTPPEATAATPARVRVHVRLDDALAGELGGHESVFVFARAVDGPPAPLAVYRTRVDALPLEVELDDSMAMMPALRLSRFDTVVVGARVSQGGEPTAQPGDLQGVSDPVRVSDAETVQVAIDEVVR